MRIVRIDPLGLSDAADLELSARERAILAKAARILAEIRAHAGGDDDADYVTDVALAAYVCAEIADEGRVRL